jgi:hypothetical protein
VSEAGKVERDDVIVVAQRLVDRLPADRGLSDPVQQDQWLTRSGSMMGEIVEGGRSQAGRDECLLVVGGGDGFRAPSPVQVPPPAALFPRWACGWPVTRASRQSGTSFSVPWQLPGPRPRPFRARRRDPLAISSTQLASQERCRAGPSCRRRVGFRAEGLGRVSVATLHNVGEVLRLSVGPGPRPTRAEVATQPVRPVPRSTACSECAPQSRPGVTGLPASVLCGTAYAHRHQLGVIKPGRY